MVNHQDTIKNYSVSPLLERQLILRIRQTRNSPNGEQGYSLALALIAGFVLLIGVGALASRGSLGFIGQVFQTQNRQARDVAEAAIAEFAITMNQERNRHLLIAGTTENWQNSKWGVAETDFRNVCTVFNNNFVPSLVDGNPQFINPDSTAINRFLPKTTSEELIQGDNSRKFIVERVEFLNQQRNPYVNSSGGFSNFTNDSGAPVSYANLYRSGAQRSLVRITVRGLIERNGRISTARVAREFEVVPKCCKRSFGQNTIGGTNWGRDQEACGASLAGKLSGIIIGTQGSDVLGSGNTKPIIQEDGSALTTASCFVGTVGSPADSPLLGSPNPDCGPLVKGGISYNAAKVDYTPPTYINVGAISANVNLGNGVNLIYFDPGAPRSPQSSGLFLKKGNAAPIRLDGLTTGIDPCYVKNAPAAGQPYFEVNCLISGLDLSGGNKDLYIDTSAAKINFFTSGDVNISGSNDLLRIHGNPEYRLDLNNSPTRSACIGSNPTQSELASCLIKWVAPGFDPTVSDNRHNTFLELCKDRNNYDCEKVGDDELYSVRRLLNFYADGNQEFRLNGGSAGVGLNIYAPKGTVRFNGGGNDLNFMGQIFADKFIPNGNINLFTFGGGAGVVSGVSNTGFAFGRALVDFAIRSFTQSSGFGL